MNQNKNTPCHIEYVIPGIQQQGAGLSIFNLQQNPQSYIEQDRSNRKNAFAAFINSRNQYLTRLTSLGNNWISGSSKQPTDQSINLSKELLNNLAYWYNDTGHQKFVYPKVIMSPTPIGGIAMEIELFPEMRAFVTIYNEEIEYEVESEGYYVEFKADKDNISNQLLALYNSNEYKYTPERQLLPEILE
jgi:hypothetical protein